MPHIGTSKPAMSTKMRKRRRGAEGPGPTNSNSSDSHLATTTQWRRPPTQRSLCTRARKAWIKQTMESLKQMMRR